MKNNFNTSNDNSTDSKPLSLHARHKNSISNQVFQNNFYKIIIFDKSEQLIQFTWLDLNYNLQGGKIV